MLINNFFLPPESTITLVDLFPNTDSKSTLRPAEGCGCATGEDVNPKKNEIQNAQFFNKSTFIAL